MIRLLRYLRHGGYNRRRTLLALNGLIWAVYGWSIATNPRPGAQFGVLPEPFHTLLTTRTAAFLWVGCGAFAFLAAVLPRVPRREPLGFNCLLVPALAWTFTGLWSWTSWLITDGLLGAPRAWVGAVVWLVIVVYVLVTAGWPDDPGPSRTARDDESGG